MKSIRPVLPGGSRCAYQTPSLSNSNNPTLQQRAAGTRKAAAVWHQVFSFLQLGLGGKRDSNDGAASVHEVDETASNFFALFESNLVLFFLRNTPVFVAPFMQGFWIDPCIQDLYSLCPKPNGQRGYKQINIV